MSLAATFSETTSSSSPRSASRTASARGRLTAGLVPITHSALISPRAMASNICTALRPSPVTRFGACQKRRTQLRSAVDQSPCGRPACWRARRPRVRPWRWAALSAKADRSPRLPMRPVARWQLMMALTLSVPCADWFTPCDVAGDDPVRARSTTCRISRCRCRRGRYRSPLKRCCPRDPWRRQAHAPGPACARRRSASRALHDRPARREVRSTVANRCRVGLPGADPSPRWWPCGAGSMVTTRMPRSARATCMRW